MSRQGAFNHCARRSGGQRPTRFTLPNLSREDLEILAQESLVRKEFGEEGVKRFWEMLPTDVKPVTLTSKPEQSLSQSSENNDV
jgi:hypothetical protein